MSCLFVVFYVFGYVMIFDLNMRWITASTGCPYDRRKIEVKLFSVLEDSTTYRHDPIPETFLVLLHGQCIAQTNVLSLKSHPQGNSVMFMEERGSSSQPLDFKWCALPLDRWFSVIIVLTLNSFHSSKIGKLTVSQCYPEK